MGSAEVTVGGRRHGRAGFLLHALVSSLRAAPASCGFATVVLLAWVLGRAHPEWFQAGADATLTQQRWWTPLTALALPPTPVHLVIALLLILTAVVWAERIAGTRRTAIAIVGGGTASVALGVAVQSAIARWPGAGSLASASVGAPAIAIVVAVAAASAVAPVLWRRRIRLVLAAVVIVFALYAGDAAAWYRVCALIVGFAIGEVWARGLPIVPRWVSSVGERRALIAGAIAIAGFGPFAALAADGGYGPLSFIETFFTDVNEHLVAVCAVHPRPICDHETALLLTRGVGPALLAVVPLVLLIVSAIGLRVGRRAAWLLALLVLTVLTVTSIVSFALGLVSLPGDAIDRVLWILGAIVLPIVLVGVLLVNRRAFDVRATRRAAVRLAIVVFGTFALVLAVFVIAESILRSSWTTAPSPLQLLADGIERLLPPAMFFGVGVVPFPHRGAGLVLWQWMGVVFWTVATVGLLRLFASVRTDVLTRTERYVAILRTTDAGSLGWMGTWPGAQHWFTPDGEAAVAFRVEAGVALAISDPACDADRLSEVLRGFVDFATGSGWIPAFTSVHPATTEALAALGWASMTVAEETVIDPAAWTMAGKAGADVRHPVTRMRREGVTSVWTTWADLAPADALRIREISEQWVAEKALPEMGFTLGGIEEMQSPDVRIMLARDATGGVVAVTSWLPVFRDGSRVGWTLDVMRRAPEAPNGVMEFVIAETLEQARADGLASVSLSGAPLAVTTDLADGSTLIASLMRRVSGALEPLYGFASLLRFKRKFRPEYRTLSLVYADPMELAQIGTALTRAYLPTASRHDLLLLARGLLDRSST